MCLSMRPESFEILGEEIVSESGQYQIAEAVFNVFLDVNYRDWQHRTTATVAETIEYHVGWEWSTSYGTFPKRLAKRVKHVFGVTLDKDLVSKLGKVARENVTMHLSNHILLISDQIDWEDGDYGDSGSCFWGDRSAARDIILEAGGGSLRIHSPSNYPVARCLWLPHGGSVVLFNAYARRGRSINLETFATVLSKAKEAKHYRKIGISHNDDCDGTLYLNGGSGFIVDSEPVNHIDYVNFEFDFETCRWCERFIHSYEGVYEGPHGNTLCEECYDEARCECESCGEEMWKDDAIAYHGEYLCSDCMNDIGWKCFVCGQWQENSVPKSQSRLYERMQDTCPSCITGTLLRRCHMCGVLHYPSIRSAFDRNEFICLQCNVLHTRPCTRCGMGEDPAWIINGLCRYCRDR